MPIGSYLVNPGSGERHTLSGGVVSFERPDVQGLAVCSCHLHWQWVYAPAPRRWKKEWLTESCVALQQKLDRLMQLPESECRTEILFDAEEKLIRDEQGKAEQTAILALFSGMRTDRLKITPLVAGPGSICLLTAEGGLTVLAQHRFALQTVAASPCLVLMLDRRPERNNPKSLLQVEKMLLDHLEKAETPEKLRQALDVYGLRAAVFWGWEDFDGVKQTFRVRRERITALLQHLEQFPETMAERILRSFGAGE